MTTPQKCKADAKTGNLVGGMVDLKNLKAVRDAECGKPAKYKLNGYYLCEVHAQAFMTTGALVKPV